MVLSDPVSSIVDLILPSSSLLLVEGFNASPTSPITSPIPRTQNCLLFYLPVNSLLVLPDFSPRTSEVVGIPRRLLPPVITHSSMVFSLDTGSSLLSPQSSLNS